MTTSTNFGAVTGFIQMASLSWMLAATSSALPLKAATASATCTNFRQRTEGTIHRATAAAQPPLQLDDELQRACWDRLRKRPSAAKSRDPFKNKIKTWVFPTWEGWQVLECNAGRLPCAGLAIFFAQRFYFLSNCVLERFDSLAGHRRDLIQLQLLFLAVFL